MEKYPVNYQGGRSMCGNGSRQGNRNMARMGRPMPMREERSSCPCMEKRESMFKHVDQMPLAMAYVPIQRYTTTFDLSYALRVGTIFPDLCKPFCGKGGHCR